MKKITFWILMFVVVSISVCFAWPSSLISVNNNWYTSEYEWTEVTFTVELTNESCTLDESSVFWSQIDPISPDSLYATSNNWVDLNFDLPDVDSDTNYTYNVKADVDCGPWRGTEETSVVIQVKNIPEPIVDARDWWTVYIWETVELTWTVTWVMTGCTESYMWNETSLNWITIHNPTSLTWAYFEIDTMSDWDSVWIDLTVNLSGCVQQWSYLDNLYLFIEEEIIVDAWENQNKESTESVSLSWSVSWIWEFCDVSYSWTETSSYGVVISWANSLTGAWFDTSSLTEWDSADIQLSVDVNSCSDFWTYTDSMTVNIVWPTPVELDAWDNQQWWNWDTINLSWSLNWLNDDCTYSAYWSELSSFGTVINWSTSLTDASVSLTWFNWWEQLEYLLSVNVNGCVDSWTYTWTTQVDIKWPATVNIDILTWTTKNYIWDNVSLTWSLTWFSNDCTVNYQRQETTGYWIQITNPNNITWATFSINSLTWTTDITMKFTATLSGCYETWEFSDYQQFTVYEKPVVDAWEDQQVDLWEVVSLTGSVDWVDSWVCSVSYSWVEDSSFWISISNADSLTWAYFEVSWFTWWESIWISLQVTVNDCTQLKNYEDSLVVSVNDDEDEEEEEDEQEEDNNSSSWWSGWGGWWWGSYYSPPVIKTPKEEQQEKEQDESNDEKEEEMEDVKEEEDNEIKNPLDEFKISCKKDKTEISYDDVFENESYKFKPWLVVKCPFYCRYINYWDLIWEYDGLDYLYINFEVNCSECRSVNYDDVVYEVWDNYEWGDYLNYGFSCNECKNVDYDDIFDNNKQDKNSNNFPEFNVACNYCKEIVY